MDRIYVMQLVRSFQVGQISRRAFLQRASAAVGGMAAANLMTILATCKNAGDTPYDYLLDVMRRMPLLNTSEIGALIPDHWSAKSDKPVTE